jgi:hypothetical protein
MKPTYEEMTSVRITCKADALKYVGKSIWYLRDVDIDKSGRGYYFPRFMVVDDIVGKEFHEKQHEGYLPYRDIKRVKIAENIPS